MGLGPLKCDSCELPVPQAGQKVDTLYFLPRADLDFNDPRCLSLFLDAVSRIPNSGRPIQSVTRVKLRKRGNLPGLVGQTTYMMQGYQTSQNGKTRPRNKNVVTFYSTLLSRLSDDAVAAVMVHELAHAWLNEHVGPEASTQREEDADILAEMWGFGTQLRALESETDPVPSKH